MSKEDYNIKRITKKEASILLDKYHYLSEISRGFKSGFNYGLFNNTDNLVGVIIFTGFPVPELSKGMLGLDRNNQEGLFELSRLVIHPKTQENEYNITSWFVAHSIKLFRKETNVKVILSYADSAFHKGTIYRACNFKYYGLTASKKDFWIKQEDGTFIKHSRGSVKNKIGEWRERTRKHRFVLVFDKKLKMLWKEEEYNVQT